MKMLSYHTHQDLQSPISPPLPPPASSNRSAEFCHRSIAATPATIHLIYAITAVQMLSVIFYFDSVVGLI